MKIFCNHPEHLPKELKELFLLNDYEIKEYDPLQFDLEQFSKDKDGQSSEVYIFLCYINYIQISDLNQFPFLSKNNEINESIKFIGLFNDSQNNYQELQSYKNISDFHFLSDPHFSLIQKIKLIKSNWETNKVWGAKILALDFDISNLKLLLQMMAVQNLLTICCTNFYDAKKYLNKQIKLIIVSEAFALNKNFGEYLIEMGYNRSKICIMNQGTKELINQIRSNGFHIIFERPIKLENFMQVILSNIRTTTTSIFKKKKQELESLNLPLKELLEDKQIEIENLKVTEDYYYQPNSATLEDEKSILLSKGSNLNAKALGIIRSDLDKFVLNVKNENFEPASHLSIKKDDNFYQFAKNKLNWLLENLFVNITQSSNFPKIYPDHWFVFYQKDLRKAIFSPAVLIQFLTFEMYGKREYIYQCLNASILCSQILMRAIPNEFGEWPDKMEEEWEMKQKEHFTLIKLALSIRYDLFQNLTSSYSQNAEDQLELNKTESNILLSFQWISPFEVIFEQTNLARILKIVHRYICLSTGIHSKLFNEEPLSTQEVCFKMLFEDSSPQFRKEELKDFFYLMKMWNLWQYYEEILIVKKFPCLMAKDIHVTYKPVKIECQNHLRAPDFQHLDFCKGCLSPYTNMDIDRKVYYCRSGNEKLAPLAKKIFGPDADIEGIYDPDINKSKKSHLL